MTYIEVGGAVALGGLILAVLNALHARLRDRWADGSSHAASDGERDANIRALNVQMSMQTDMMREVRDTTRDMSKQLGSHTEQLARHGAQLAEHERRLSVMEGRCDLRHGVGGTE
ncbi:MAG: hypothetical protein SOY67_04455 [Collinsella sp.]|nr:hypothetical protein [Collinsella sp.]